MQKHPKLSLIEHFKNLPDPRVERTKDHELIDVLTIAICTLLCAGESFNDMEDFGQAKEDWFRTFLTLKNGIPVTTRSTACLRHWTRWPLASASWRGRKVCVRRWHRRSWRWTARRCGERWTRIKTAR